jgi:hypothetical protein
LDTEPYLQGPKALYDLLYQCGEFPMAHEQRKWAAIRAADVVGYSPLAQREKSGTVVVASFCHQRR